MSVITHNLASMAAQRNYKISTGKAAESSKKLSTGFKINCAADDAAGLQISEELRIQVRGLTRASQNIDDGVSFVKTADGALGEVQSMLHRMKELAVQAANDTNTEFDRKALDEEVQQLKTAMTDIFQNTEFNSRKIWGDKTNDFVETGLYSEEYAVEYNVEYFRATLTDTNKTSIPVRDPMTSSLGYYTIKADETGLWAEWDDCAGNKHKTGTLEWEEDELWKGTHQVSLAELIAIKQTDGKDYTGYATNDYPEANNFNFTWTVNDYATKEQMIASINNSQINTWESSSEQIDEVFYNTNTPDTSTDFSVVINFDALLTSGTTFNSDDDDVIEGSNVNLVNNPVLTNIPTDKFIFEFAMNNIGKVIATSVESVSYCPDMSPQYENIWWHYDTDADGNKYKTSYRWLHGSGDLKSIEAAVNKLDTQSPGGTFFLTFDLAAETPYTSIDGTQTATDLGHMTMAMPVSSTDTIDDIKNRLAQITGADIKINSSRISSTVYNDTVSKTQIRVPEYQYGYTINIQAGSLEGNTIQIKYKSLSLGTLGIHDSNVLTHVDASNAIDAIDNALNEVTAQRSLFGAYQNRMEHSARLDDNTAENSQAAESRIRDTDMADEMVSFSTSNIISRTGESVITQANQQAANVVDLLRQ